VDQVVEQQQLVVVPVVSELEIHLLLALLKDLMVERAHLITLLIE
tara:strand:+ start:305 stop:439 length:135 start_codon:yes stop_codon:yes gene_type:complete